MWNTTPVGALCRRAWAGTAVTIELTDANLYEENDELIRSVMIDVPDGEPVEADVASGEPAPHPRPKSEWVESR